MKSKVLVGTIVVLLIGILSGLVLHTPPMFSIASNVEAVRTGTVHILKQGECQGSGAIISPDGIIFTAKHVTDGRAGEYTVTLDDGREFDVKAVIEDGENDMAFMLLDVPKGTKLPYVRLSHVDPRVGDMVVIGGSPFGIENFNTFTLGVVSAKGRELGGKYDWHVMTQTDSAANPGNSGGPVFNMRNEVIGVLVAGYNATLNYSVPVARFRDTIRTIRNLLYMQRFQEVEEVYEADIEWGAYEVQTVE